MIVTCEECHAKFHLEDSLIKPNGSRVRCSKCKHVFRLYPPHRETETAAAPSADRFPEPAKEPTQASETPDRGEERPDAPDIPDADAPDTPHLTDSADLSLFDTDFFNLESIGQEPHLESQDASGPSKDVSPSDLPDTSRPERPEDQGIEFPTDPLFSEGIEPLTIDQLVEGIDRTEFPSDSPSSPQEDAVYHQIETLNLEDLEKLIETPETNLQPMDDPLKDPESIRPADSEFGEKFALEDLELIARKSEKPDIGEKISETAPAFSGTTGRISPLPASVSLDNSPLNKQETITAFPLSAESTADTAEENPPDSSPSKKVSTPLLILFLLVLIGGGAYAALTWFPDLKIPFFTSKMASVPEEPGNLKIKAYEISSRFVENVSSGRLFLIAGKVRNDYPESRKHIQIKGTLFNKDKQPVLTQTAFCGNMVPQPELTSLTIQDIHRRLENPDGDNGLNADVPPTQSIPFMVVFSSLPDNLDEFTLEITQSRKR
jgi:predicted Zn finger-like uncharacterized protein